MSCPPVAHSPLRRSCRSASSLLTNALENGIEQGDGRFWLVSTVSWLLIALTGVWSTDFLNKAMMHFGTNEVPCSNAPPAAAAPRLL